MTRLITTACEVVPSQGLSKLMDDGIILNADKKNIQPASVDLTLGSKAYRLQASFLSQSDTVRNRMKGLIMYEVDLDRGAILEREAVYLVPLEEKLRLPEHIEGKTNPKSSTGRLDVFTRVITDRCRRFEEIAPGYDGELFLEVVPRSFTIKVKSGQRLNQLRLFANPSVGGEKEPRDNPFINGAGLEEEYSSQKLLFGNDGEFLADAGKHISKDGLLMGVDIISPCGPGGPIGYKAKKNSKVIDLEKIAEYDAEDFWEAIYPPKNGRLILEPEEFYIFASKEKIRVPLTCAAEMVEFDAGSGELRTHYAGFFDPGFGYGKNGEVKGTKAVLEVRPHDVPFIIEDGQILFKMKYERMAAKPDIWYGSEIGSNYYDQTLRLSKQFRQK